VAHNNPETQKIYSHNWYKKHSELIISRTAERRRLARKWVQEQKETLKCEICGENRTVCLDFHHRDPTKKDTEISTTISRGWSIKHIQEEISKCQVLCSNCHRALHNNLAG
jgi:hypothetical protein